MTAAAPADRAGRHHLGRQPSPRRAGVQGSRSKTNIHQRITNEWEAFRAKTPKARKPEIEKFAAGIDKKYLKYWFK